MNIEELINNRLINLYSKDFEKHFGIVREILQSDIREIVKIFYKELMTFHEISPILENHIVKRRLEYFSREKPKFRDINEVWSKDLKPLKFE